MIKITELKNNLQCSPDNIEFQDVIDIIDEYYSFTATEFSNGTEYDLVLNKAGENNGSCKIFSFARLQNLSEQETLHCFGQYYRNDVLKHPDSESHANIRTFMKHGWENIKFTGEALSLRQAEI